MKKLYLLFLMVLMTVGCATNNKISVNNEELISVKHSDSEMLKSSEKIRKNKVPKLGLDILMEQKKDRESLVNNKGKLISREVVVEEENHNLTEYKELKTKVDDLHKNNRKCLKSVAGKIWKIGENTEIQTHYKWIGIVIAPWIFFVEPISGTIALIWVFFDDISLGYDSARLFRIISDDLESDSC